MPKGKQASGRNSDSQNGQSKNGNQAVRRSPRNHQGSPSVADAVSAVEKLAIDAATSPKSDKPDNRTCLAYEERCMRHKCATDHPERPERIQRIYAKLREEGLVDRSIPVKSREATMDEILLVHDEAYIEELASTPKMEIDELKLWQEKWNSIYVNYDSWQSSLLACGNLLECVDTVVDGRTLNGVAVIRPPGHHAEPDAAYGFCFLNNVAIAAKYAREMLGVGKVLILDWDVHHGNGIQSAFWTDPSVLYISLHRYDHGRFFPSNERNNYTDVGEGAGRGFTVNIPWNGKGMGDAEYLEAFKKILMPIATEFNPELVFVSAGFDAARGDPLGGYRVTPYGYAQMTSMLCTLANGRIILALEGGYNLTSISASMAACVRVLLGEDPVDPDEPIRQCAEVAKTTIKEAVEVLSEFWPSLLPPSDSNLSANIEMHIDSTIAEADDMVKTIDQLASDIEEQLNLKINNPSQAEPPDQNPSSAASRTGLIYEEVVSSQHWCPWDPNHIETPARLTTSLRKIRERGLMQRCVPMTPRRADVSEICSYHDMDLVEKLSETVNWDEEKLEKLSGQFDDVYVNSHTYESALIAAGSTVDGVKAVLDGRISNAMVLVRPPGHHAMKAAINGFCIFNNVAIAAKMALETYKLKRILIVDWDVHHGQGTQRAFYDDPRVLYFSIHRFENGTFWPNLRESHWDYVGSGKGQGYNVNVPLNKIGMGDAEYLAIFTHILLPLATEFDPELVIISAGYDAAIGCPEGRMEVSPLCYGHLTRMLMPLASGRLAVILEGGYCLDSLAEGVAMTLRALLGDYCPKMPTSISKPIDPAVTEVILNLAYCLKDKWTSMAALTMAVDTVLTKLERPPFTTSEPIYNWTPMEQTVYVTKNKYPHRPAETVEHFRKVVTTMMAECPLERAKSKLRKVELLNEFLDEEKPGQEHKDRFDDHAAAIGLCRSALDSIQKRETQCAMVVLSGYQSVDPIADLVSSASKVGMKRVLIIDCHSKSQSKNARTFYEDKSVLYVSIHRTDDWDRMDHCRPEDIGRGAGAGFNVNLAWNGKAAVDSEDAFALHHVVLPLAYSFDPELVIIYSDFTQADIDDESKASAYNSPAFFAYMVHQLQMLAEGKLLLIMKGDADDDIVDVRAIACAETLLTNKLPNDLRLIPGAVSPDVIMTYAETISHLRPYWPYLQCILAPNPHQSGAIIEWGSVEPVADCPHMNGHGVCETVLSSDQVNLAAPCDICGNVGENWICLTCWKVHCSRFVNEHAVLHSTMSGHPIALSMADLSAWCYICDTYVTSETVTQAKRALHLAKFGVDMPL